MLASPFDMREVVRLFFRYGKYTIALTIIIVQECMQWHGLKGHHLELVDIRLEGLNIELAEEI